MRPRAQTRAQNILTAPKAIESGQAVSQPNPPAESIGDAQMGGQIVERIDGFAAKSYDG